MSKLEHLQFLVLMIPTFIILTAAAVSLAHLPGPGAPQLYVSAVMDPATAVGNEF